ncbi:MAG: inosine/xanthosine triphosphatase [Thermoprotei archaeon]
MTLKVVVGSSNPVKLEGVRRVFTRFYENVEIRSAPYSGAPRQPVGARQTLEGAYLRAKHSLEAFPESDYGVGVEAGLVSIPNIQGNGTTHLNTQLAVVINREGRIGVGSSAGFTLPPQVLKDILTLGKELDESFSERYGYRDLGRTVGVVHTLTKGVIDRFKLVEESVGLALIPFLNPELYF